MSSPSPEIVAVVRRMLAHATRRAENCSPIEAAELIVQGFDDRLSTLVGRAGYRLLLARALRRAQRNHPALLGVSIDSETEGYLDGLQEVAASVDETALVSALDALIAELIALIARFLGADLAIRMVRDAFPEVAFGTTGLDREESNNE